MRRRVKVRGEQRKDIELERLARALLDAARQATPKTSEETREERERDAS